ncbi:hypothetical protein Areg01_29750 [Actinoplanes regularis]|nr:hypothetical protein Areg01_29750 [Actinoplanes regularis]
MAGAHETSPDDPGRASGNFWLTGHVLDEEGNPVVNTELQVNLDPSSTMLLASETGAVEAVGLPLATTTTGHVGQFKFQVPALMDIEDYREADGTYNLLFVSLSEEHSLVYRVIARLPMSSGGTARAVTPDEQILDPQELAAGQQAEADAAGTGDAVSAGTAMTGLTLPATTTVQQQPAAVSAAAASPSPVTLCKQRFPGYTLYQWKMVTNPSMRPQMYVPVQKVVTKSRMTAKYEWSNTKETTTTTGLSMANGAKVEGGLTKSVVTKAGTDFSVPKNSNYELQTNWEYRWYELYCQDPTTLPTTPWKDSNIKELRPYEFAAGARKVNTTGYSCSNSANRQSIPASDSSWVSRSTTHAITNSISYSGWSLNSSQKNTSDHKKTFFNTTTVSATICGENALPTRTDRVGEV